MDRIVHKADFERVLATRSRSRSTHFALHHVAGGPLVRVWAPKASTCRKLSTSLAPTSPQAVDDLPSGEPAQPSDWWVGCVVPKRHAKRAVTRNLLKRQIRSAFERLHPQLPAGLWLVRLRAPFAKQDFISAKSPQLAAAARSELEALLLRVANRTHVA